jgi:SPP1 gp7 family putative phage head morphogenesis protein
MPATLNETLLDAQVSHLIGLQRLGSGILRKILALLNRTDSDIADTIRERLADVEPGTIETTFTTERLNLLLDAIRAIGDRVGDEIQARLLKEALGLAEYEAEFQVSTITEHLPVRFDVVQPTIEQLQAVVTKRPFQGRLLREWAKGLGSDRSRRVHDAIRIGMVEGETTDQIVQRVRGRRSMDYKDGVLEISRRDAEAVVRTAVTHIASGAQQATYAANADLVKSWRFVATLDMRTTVSCASLDGKVFPVGKGPMPPRHFRCRSSSVPVTASFRDLGIDLDEVPEGMRASMDGAVPASLTYGDWLKKQPASVQDDILGSTRGKLFRAGDLPIDRFTDRAGAEYTLDQLRRREAGAFRKAGLAA